MSSSSRVGRTGRARHQAPGRRRLGAVALGLALVGMGSLGCWEEPYSRVPPPAHAAAGTPGGQLAGTDPFAGQTAATVLPDAKLPLLDMLGQAPPQVESYLGPPLPDSKGGMRESCVRFVPDRVWFRCKHAWQRYSDKTGTFGVVQATYEDAKAAALAFEGIPGEGPFDPIIALRTVGLELPEAGRASQPQPNVKVWEWFNGQARLVIAGRQHRVRVSVVDDSWAKSKVEIILNDPLSPDEQSRVIEAGPQREAGAAAPQ